MFWIEADSYTHDIFTRGDTAWFMGCGRAVAEGLIPYVDFTDSKGLLLWWIYAAGYWLNDYSYVGVFWISVLFSWGTFWFSYKTALLLTSGNRKTSVMATLLMSFPYYNCLVQGRFMEFRAEDFCLLFISWGVYYLVKGILDGKSFQTFVPGFMLGVGLVACIMIKWSIGVMYLCLIGGYCFLLIRNKVMKGFLWELLGILFGCFPFAIAFAHYGNFDAFIQEYFLNTSKTVSQPLAVMLREYLFVELKRLITTQSILSLFWVASALYYAHRKQQFVVPVLSGLMVLLLAVKHDLGYYTIVVAPYAIFVCVAFSEWIEKHNSVVQKYPVSFGIGWWLLNTIPNFVRNEGMWYNSDRELFYKTAYMIAQIGGGKIIGTSNYGDPGLTIPGSKYWIPQLGETSEMAHGRLHDVRECKADFIFGDYDALIDRNRYQKYVLTDSHGKTISFWGVKGLRYPPKNFKVSDMDVLLKRRVVPKCN